MLSYAKVKEFWYLLDKYKDFPELTDLKYLWGDLKEYQRLFVFDQLLIVPQGSRICEVGGGVCNVFEALLRKFPRAYECWSIDPLEGQGGGPKFSSLPWDHNGEVKLVREKIGDFSLKLPSGYFDVLFSLSVLEHISLEEWEKCFTDMVRVCKPGALIIHTVDGSVDFPIGEQYIKAMIELPGKVGLRLLHPEIGFDITMVRNDPQTHYVSPTAYIRWLKHFPAGRNTLKDGIYCRVTAFNVIYIKS